MDKKYLADKKRDSNGRFLSLSKEDYRKYLERQKQHRKKYRINNPWQVHLSNARIRCNNKNHVGYKYYGAKGIKCLLTIHQVRYLFEKDGGWQMKRASLDRKKVNKDYTIRNCRFIEYEENMKGRRRTTHTKESKKAIGTKNKAHQERIRNEKMLLR